MFDVTALAETDLGEAGRFLKAVFGEVENYPPFQREALRWKGFDAHPFAEPPRSFGVWREQRLIGHGTVAPLRFLTSAGEVTAHCVIDWAADPNTRGSGVAIYQKLYKLTAMQIGIGGSDDTRAMLPRMRMRVHQNIGVYERRERVLAHHLSTRVDWKTPARIGRDLWRNLRAPGLTEARDISARRVASFSGEATVPMPSPGAGVCSERTPALLDYALRCPVARMEGYVLEAQGAGIGYCVLSRVGTSCRIADLWIEPARDTARWSQAVGLAVQLAVADRSTASVLSAGSTAFLRGVLESQGFRMQSDQPLFVRGSGVETGAEIHFGFLDYDAYYLP
jgi:hypothetical protein